MALSFASRIVTPGMSPLRFLGRIVAGLLALSPLVAEAASVPAVFTGDPITLPFAAGQKLTRQVVSGEGISQPEDVSGKEVDGRSVIRPRREGIHVIRSTDKKAKVDEFRFLALKPPPPLHPEAVRKTLPRRGDQLLEGQPFHILAMGDSVTATGDSPELLQMMLARATGNEQIVVTTRAYPGRSVDATLRHYRRDVLETQPDLALIMYGLNDQGAGASLPGFVEQFSWLVHRLRQDCGADLLVLRPTPVIDGELTFSGISRAAGYGQWLADRMEALDVPVVNAFDAIWGSGGPTAEDTASGMWPRFPLHYRKPLTSWLESDGRGDGIHPNALGHLALARATFDEINGHTPAATLQSQGVAAWGRDGLQATYTIRRKNAGSLEIFPLPGDTIRIEEPIGTGRIVTVRVRWPEIRKPAHLLRDPAPRVFLENRPLVLAVDHSQGGARVSALTAEWPERYQFVRGRWTVQEPVFQAQIETEDGQEDFPVTLPTDRPVGRLPLLSKLQAKSGTQWAAAELAFLRYGTAHSGEAQIDGQLTEWDGVPRQVVGEPVQARWTHGPEDHRTNPAECMTHWAFLAGAKGISVAAEIEGDPARLPKDSGTLFFDPRSPTELGTPGPYFWVSVGLQDDGTLALHPGDTSPKELSGLTGQWKTTQTGIELEFFVPYQLMNTKSWPASGDLGLSIDWLHRSREGKLRTHLQWFEDGHPWNPRWFGVVRLRKNDDPLPFLVRVK